MNPYSFDKWNLARFLPGLRRMTTADATFDAPKKSVKDETTEIIKTVVYALLIAFVLRVLLFQPFTIPSASMEPNLYEGDYIKRIVGLPGDRIQVRGSRLYVNDQPVQAVPEGPIAVANAYGGTTEALKVRETLPGGKSYLTQDLTETGPGDDTGVYVVPQGCYFAMGDNRDNSVDSRFTPPSTGSGREKCGWDPTLDAALSVSQPGVGLVPAVNLVGRADIILASWYPGAALYKPWTWFTKIRPSRFFKPLH